MAAEISKDSAGGGSGRVGPGLGDRFFYQRSSRGEEEVGRLNLTWREAGCAPRRGRQEGAGARPLLVTRSI
jgi:hypothetical protein